MKKIKIAILFLSFLFSSCSVLDKQQIKIIGTAVNLKAGAVVISQEDKKMYYLDGMSNWSEEMVGKTINASGYLKIIIAKQDTILLRQQVVGEKRIIVKSKWRLNKK